VRRIIDLLDQPEAIRDDLSRDRIGERHVRSLSRIKDLNARVKLAKRVAEEGWTVKMTEDRVAKVLAKAGVAVECFLRDADAASANQPAIDEKPDAGASAVPTEIAPAADLMKDVEAASVRNPAEHGKCHRKAHDICKLVTGF
jgi:ParB-like chromosome segregation protein Spo0J